MDGIDAVSGVKSRTAALLAHFSAIPDPRDPRRIAHPLNEILLLAVCGTVCDCDNYDAIPAWGEAHLDVLRRFSPYHHGVPCGRWITLLMNRLPEGLFAEAFSAWVRETWPGGPGLVAIDGKIPDQVRDRLSRRSHDRAEGREPLHLVSALATARRLVIGQHAVAAKSSEHTAIPPRTKALRVRSSPSTPSSPARSLAQARITSSP